MKTVYDVQQLLKKFGTIIYIGDRVADLELMATEISELNQSQLIDQKDFTTAMLILKQAIRLAKEREE